MTERANVLRWNDAIDRAHLDIYHPSTALGAYGQNYQREQLLRLLTKNGIRLDRLDILDLGSGTGTWCRYFAELKGTTAGIVGIELGRTSIARARALSPIEYIEGDMTQSSALVDRHFDLVTAFVSLMFLRDHLDLRLTLEAAADVLRPGGHLLISEKNTPHDLSHDWSGWSIAELVAHSRAAGLDFVDAVGLFKIFFGRFDSYYRVSFRRMDWFRVAERVLPGPWGYYFLLLRKPAKPPSPFTVTRGTLP